MNHYEYPHQYEGSFAQKAMQVSQVAALISLCCALLAGILFLTREINPEGWALVSEPVIGSIASGIVSFLGFYFWALDSYGYFAIDFIGERKEPTNPFC